MLGTPEIEAIRAALLYWQEEMCPHGEEAAQPYLDVISVRPLSAAEIDSLRTYLSGDVRYAILDPADRRLLSTDVWASLEQARAHAGGQAVVVTVLIPPLATTTLS